LTSTSTRKRAVIFFHAASTADFVGDVERERLGRGAARADGFECILQRLLAARDGGDGCAFLRERESDGLAQAAARAGDEGDFIGEKFHK
jgi:hypothetical protein